MKFYLKIVAVCVFSLMFLTDFAVAHENADLQGGHPFVSVGLGKGTYNNSLAYGDLFNSNGGSVSLFSYSAFIWQAGGGYLWYRERFAYGVEALYSHLNDNKTDSSTGSTNASTAKINSYSLLGVGRYFISPSFNIALKAGATVMSQSFTATYSPTTLYYPPRSASTTVVAPTAGIGMGFIVARNWSINLDVLYAYSRKLIASYPQPNLVAGYPPSPANQYSTSLMTVTLGATYTF
jgi:hypothetical protein